MFDRTQALPCLAAGLATLALAAPPADAQGVLRLGPLGGPGDIRLADAGGLLGMGQPLALTGIELLPLTFSLHSPLDGWDASRPQVQPLPDGASGVRIPGHGCLY
ncbi:MAG: hypothetical protein P1V81_18745, partial [Planctomycetota bacterium]|nr:hypothetical protein [Planctomycetota bacterium]